MKVFLFVITAASIYIGTTHSGPDIYASIQSIFHSSTKVFRDGRDEANRTNEELTKKFDAAVNE